MEATMVLAFLVVAFAVAINAASINTPEDNEEPHFVTIYKRVVDKMFMNKTEEIIRKTLKENEPFEIPIYPEIFVKRLLSDMKFNVNNVRLSQTSDFIVNNMEKGLPEVWAKFEVTFPNVRLDGDFVANGFFGLEKISGQGKFTVHMKDVVQKGYITAKLEQHEAELRSIELDWDVEDFNFFLDIEFESKSLKKLLHIIDRREVYEYVLSRKKELASIISNLARKKVNKLLAGKSPIDLLDWIESVAM